VIGKDVAGTNDHGMKQCSPDRLSIEISKTASRCKRKNRLFKRFQTTALAASQIGTSLKQCVLNKAEMMLCAQLHGAM
jgi:hypothetical protein